MHRYASLLVLMATAGAAAPTAPPNQEDNAVVEAYIHAIETKDAAALARTLTYDVEIRSGPRVLTSNRADWETLVARDFAPANVKETVESAWYGLGFDNGDFAPTVLLIEREDRNFGDCCSFHRSEVLTIRNHYVAKIDRSPAVGYAVGTIQK